MQYTYVKSHTAQNGLSLRRLPDKNARNEDRLETLVYFNSNPVTLGYLRMLWTISDDMLTVAYITREDRHSHDLFKSIQYL